MNRFFLSLFISLQILNMTEAKAEGFWRSLIPPAEQGRLRTEHSMSIGIPLTGPFNLPSQLQYRFGDRFLLGGGLIIEEKGKDDDDEFVTSGFRYEAKSHIGSSYVQYYVSGKSGFHVGLGAEWRSGHITEYEVDRNGAEQKSSGGSFRAIYGGPSFGWTWIWENGITFGFDISKRKQFQSEIHVSDFSGLPTNDSLGRVSRKAIPESVPGMVMVGYSF